MNTVKKVEKLCANKVTFQSISSRFFTFMTKSNQVQLERPKFHSMVKIDKLKQDLSPLSSRGAESLLLHPMARQQLYLRIYHMSW